ncbi:hypothetical protein [Staphylococcus auricularis]|uniref:Uncharacterized protein n=1 Tax=Staphylococcus auricularis TaxID=29379 RepID=A0ABX5IE94_9STAP|nr:hypothetical protein [Staphylococcus auricularis]PTH17831.1 hypothetical protein BU607_07005 [Staphylococcus auricularis]PTH25902.1 hypothetical protein BU608_06260 [Staphylococcus auricularis]
MARKRVVEVHLTQLSRPQQLGWNVEIELISVSLLVFMEKMKSITRLKLEKNKERNQSQLKCAPDNI